MATRPDDAESADHESAGSPATPRDAAAAVRASLSLEAFLGTDFEGRIRLACALSPTRLHSEQLAEVWSRVLGTIAAPDRSAGAERLAPRLMRELLMLDPAGPAAEPTLASYLDDGTRSGPSTASLVYLVISCVPRLPKAQRLHAQLSRSLRPAFIVIGDPSLDEARFDGDVLRVPAPDTYEALPTKVLEALLAVRRALGPVGVVKIDDDCIPSAPPDPALVASALAETDYAGTLAGHRRFDRCWHVGKAATVHTPCALEFKGKWARGATYFVGARALDALVRDYLFHPTEIAGQLFEDKLVGDMLRKRGIAVTRLDVGALLGLGVVVDDAKAPLSDFVIDTKEHRARAPRSARSSRVILAFVGTIDPDCQWNTIGDVMALYNVAKSLDRLGVDFQVAWDGFLFDLSDRTVPLAEVNPSDYGCFVYVCGPAHKGLAHLYDRFAGVRRRVAVGVSIIRKRGHDPRQWFDAVHARDSAERVSFDLAPADIGWPHIRVDPRQRQPGASVCLVGPAGLYGRGNTLHDEAEALIGAGLDAAGVQRRVPVQTLVRPDMPNPYVAEVELQASRLMVTTRMHGSILSLLYGVPVIAVDQIRGGAKVTRVVSATGWPVLRADRDGKDALVDLVRRIEAGDMDDALARARAETIARSREALRDSVDLITSML